jgi:uncharacterized protein
MNIGILTLDIRIPLNRSLKGKRRVIKGLKKKIRTKFNVSVAEVDNHNLWQRATFAVVAVGQDKRIVNSTLSKVNNFIEKEVKSEVLDHQIEVI